MPALPAWPGSPGKAVQEERERAEAVEALKADLTDVAPLLTDLSAVSDASVLSTQGLVSVLEDLISGLGLADKFHWGLSLPRQFTNGELVENAARYSLYKPPRDIIVRGLSYVVNTVAAGNDEVAVAIKSEDGATTLRESGKVAGKLNANTGRVDVDFTEDIELQRDNFYRPAIQPGPKTGATVANVMQYTTVQTILSTLLDPGSAIEAKHRALAGNTPVFPFASAPALTASTTCPLLLIRER